MSKANRQYIIRQTLPEMFDASVLKYMDCTCQSWKDNTGKIRNLTYAQVGRIVRELSIGLICLGLEKQDRVAIMSYNIPQWLWADFASLNSGAVTVTVYPTFSHRELAYIINDSEALFLFIESEEDLHKAVNIWSEMPSLQKIIVMQNDYSGNNPDILNLGELQELGIRCLQQKRAEYDQRWHSINIHDRMTIIYTSGTTGQQKGVVHTHLSINAAIARDLTIMPEVTEDDILISLLPLSHSFERQCGHMLTLSMGGTIAYPTPGNSLLQNFQDFKPSWFLGVPEIYEILFNEISEHLKRLQLETGSEEITATTNRIADALLNRYGYIGNLQDLVFVNSLPVELRQQYLEADQEIFSTVRSLIGGRYRFSYSAAGALPAHLCKFFAVMKIPIMEGYGLVESSNTVTANHPGQIIPGSVGALCPGVEAKLADDGEFLILTDTLFLEYWKDNESTQEAFTEEGYFRTGDIMQQMDNGYWVLLDRKKSILALKSGRKVSTARYDKLLLRGDWIDQICVIGDDEPYVTALLVPDFDLFIEYFKENNIDFNFEDLQFEEDSKHSGCIKVGMDFIRQPALRKQIEQEIQRLNAELEDYELIKKYTIINRRFSRLTGEVTPTSKLKRKAIIEHFAVEIENMYR